MSIALDIILLVSIIYSGYKGYKKGLLEILIKLASIFVIIFLIWLLINPLSEMVLKNKKTKEFENNLSKKIESVFGKDGENLEKEENKDNNLQNFLIKIKKDEIKQQTKNDDISFAEFAAKKLTKLIIRGVLIFVLFTIFNLILIILSKVLTKTVNTFEITSLINSLGGSVLNIIKTLIIIYLLIYSFKMVSIIMPKSAVETVNKTIIVKKIYNSNYLSKKMMGVLK